MPTNIGNQVAQFTITSTSTNFLAADDSILSTTRGISATTANDIRITVAGTIIAESYGIFASTGANVSTNVLDGGYVQGEDIGISLEGSGIGYLSSNAGSIKGFDRGGVIILKSDGTFTNSGDIFGVVQGMDYWSSSTDGALINTGLITGGDGVSINGDRIKVFNSGEIYGENSNGSGSGFGIDIESSGSEVVIRNTGTIGGNEGAISGNGQRDVVYNSGTLLGDVLLEGGNDTYLATGDGQTQGAVEGGSGDDKITGGRGSDTFRGGTGVDKLIGDAGADTLEGDAGRDIIQGGDGADQIKGGADGDLMIGGAGGDEFLYTDTLDIGFSGALRDEIRDFEQGLDIINLASMVGPEFIFLGTGGFTSGGVAELRLAEAGGSTFVQLDYDGDGTGDGRILVRGVLDMTEGDFIL